MTGIVHHTRQRLAWKESRHTYLLDTGSRIAIRQMMVLPTGEPRLLPPPYPSTQYFEIVIDESRTRGQTTFSFQSIFPVDARRTPDWRFLRFRIRRGSWKIVGHIPEETAAGDRQWVHTDEFNMLYLAYGGKHDPESLLGMFAGRLDAIASGRNDGISPVPANGNGLAVSEDLNTMLSQGLDASFRDSMLARKDTIWSDQKIPSGRSSPASGAVSVRETSWSGNSPAADSRLDLNGIEELNDMSWLFE